MTTSRRFESISGILNRTATDPSLEQAGASAPAVAEEPAPTGVTKLRPAARSRPASEAPAPPAAKASAGSDGGVRRIAFRLDPALHTALTARATDAKTSHGQVVLDCVEAAYQAGVLIDLVAAEATPTQTDGLFPRLKSRTTAQASVPVEIRLHARAATVLDQLVDQTSADSRTQLVVAALRHQLS
jgi:hypothetical protein